MVILKKLCLGLVVSLALSACASDKLTVNFEKTQEAVKPELTYEVYFKTFDKDNNLICWCDKVTVGRRNAITSTDLNGLLGIEYDILKTLIIRENRKDVQKVVITHWKLMGDTSNE